MRLSDEQRRVIKQAVGACFADDSKRGGDIDLLINTSLADPDAVARAEIAFKVQVQRALGEQRIDVLVDYPGRRVRPPIFAIAEQTGIRL